eukprot:TRINITY_DN3243_c0_g1_i2.p1 TRINITY_DN3243_c0_g1~~TRINITY_DN3243_c0_g1_i2.p1  ORF type:complete len:288 (+),score=27.04 TRINITY_DN3243_c0_g1_i2:95-958(+)
MCIRDRYGGPLPATMSTNSFIVLCLMVSTVESLTPFPLPKNLVAGNSSIAISPMLAIGCSPNPQCNSVACASDVMTQAFARYAASMAPTSASHTDGPGLTQVRVCVNTADLTLGPNTTEEYSVNVSATEGIDTEIVASSVYGALHGLESLLQLVDTDAGHVIANAPVLITDAPRFGYRGLMIDTGRHFLPAKFLMRVIDGLHASRLNMLHWHLVDATSFPCGSDKFPQLAQKGAYDTRAVYSTADMRAVVEYGRLRGVRVMPEWDIPGHGSWGAGMPSVMGLSLIHI